MLKCKDTLKADGIPSERRQQPHKTDTRRTDTLSMFIRTLKSLPLLPYCKVLIRESRTRSGPLDYCLLSRRSGAYQSFGLFFDIFGKNLLKMLIDSGGKYCHKAGYSHLMDCWCAHKQHWGRNNTQEELWDGMDETLQETHLFFFAFPFFIYLWFRILIGWNDVCGSLRVIIELRVI